MKKAFVRNFPDDLTSYDFLKAVAVMTMIIDHLGAYFFPDQEGWRIVGRMSLPIWMFLIGYAQTRKVPEMFYWAAGILLISDVITGQSIFPLSIIVTIIITRYLIDYIMLFALSNFQNLFLATFALIILAFPSMFIFEYGTQAVLFAMFGYLVRHQKKINWSNERIIIFMFLALVTYMFFQGMTINFTTIEFYTTGAGVFLVCLMLAMFRPKLYPDLTKKYKGFVEETLKVLGRQTLEVYVIHLVLFKVAVLFMHSDRYSFFGWSFF